MQSEQGFQHVNWRCSKVICQEKIIYKGLFGGLAHHKHDDWVVVSNIFDVHPENWGNDPI